jgi:hypothetical protein
MDNMSLRDVQQIASFALSLAALGIVIYKVRRHQPYPFVFSIFYLPPAVVFVLTSLYYLVVYIDTKVSDIIVSGDVSATLRVLDLVMWMLVVMAQPPKAKRP